MIRARGRSVDLDLGRCFGLDVGGTLSKLVFFEPDNHAGSARSQISKIALACRALAQEAAAAAAAASSGHPASAEEERPASPASSQSAASSPSALVSSSAAAGSSSPGGGGAGTGPGEGGDLAFHSPEHFGTFHFVSVETRRMPEVCRAIRENGLHEGVECMHAAGGGAHKYKKLFEEELGIELVPVDELKTLIHALAFLVASDPNEIYHLEDPNAPPAPLPAAAAGGVGVGVGATYSDAAPIDRRQSSPAAYPASAAAAAASAVAAAAAGRLEGVYEEEDEEEEGNESDDSNGDGEGSESKLRKPGRRKKKRDRGGRPPTGPRSGSGGGAVIGRSLMSSSAAAQDDVIIRDVGDVEEGFREATMVVRRVMTTLPIRSQLELYGYYKQAMFGECPGKRPSVLDAMGAQKWEAWAAHGSMGSVDAKRAYIATLRRLVPSWQQQASGHGGSSSAGGGGGDGEQRERRVAGDGDDDVQNDDDEGKDDGGRRSGRYGRGSLDSATSSSLSPTSAARLTLKAGRSASMGTYESIRQPVALRDALFPFVLCNIGSGVSILHVESVDKHERISGTAVGGATFWGLCRLLVRRPLSNFSEALDLAEQGHATRVNMCVRDIYGGSYKNHGLDGKLTASFFGKVPKTGAGPPPAALRRQQTNDVFGLGLPRSIGSEAAQPVSTTAARQRDEEEEVASGLEAAAAAAERRRNAGGDGEDDDDDDDDEEAKHGGAKRPRDEDICRALLMMISQNITQVRTAGIQSEAAAVVEEGCGIGLLLQLGVWSLTTGFAPAAFSLSIHTRSPT